jgi:NADPH:quinone reductase-like Zn-dependent oxidoreductase
MARKVVYERSGEPAQVVRIVESGEPQAPQRGQVLVRVTAFSVHPGDLAGIAGPFVDGDALVPGAEATGTVEAIGPDTPVAAGVAAGRASRASWSRARGKTGCLLRPNWWWRCRTTCPTQSRRN